MRSYINNGKVHKWSLDETTLEALSERKNFRYEDFFPTLEEAEKCAEARSLKAHRKIYVTQYPKGFRVDAHGVALLHDKRLQVWQKGKKL